MKLIPDNASQQGYDPTNDVYSVAVTNPARDDHVGTTLVSADNLTTNTTFYAYIDMQDYRYLDLHIQQLQATPTDTLTCTFEATNQDDGTAPASCTYLDITQLGVRWQTEAAAASKVFSAAGGVKWSLNEGVTCRYARLKYVTSNDSGGDIDLRVYMRRFN